MDAFPKSSPPIPVRSRNPPEVWGAACGTQMGVSGQLESIQTNEGGEWGNEVWADLCSERRIKLQSQVAGLHPWILERRNGLARGFLSPSRGRSLFGESDFLWGSMVSESSHIGWRVFGLSTHFLDPTLSISPGGMTDMRIRW